MKNQALFSSKDKSKKLKCCLLQFLFGGLRVKVEGSRHKITEIYLQSNITLFKLKTVLLVLFSAHCLIVLYNCTVHTYRKKSESSEERNRIDRKLSFNLYMKKYNWANSIKLKIWYGSFFLHII